MPHLTTLQIMSIVLAFFALPLIFKWVPPNPIYGFRTARTLADTSLWYRANQFCGWAIFLASTISLILFTALPSSPNEPTTLTKALVPVFVFVLPILIAVAASFFYLGRASQSVR